VQIRLVTLPAIPEEGLIVISNSEAKIIFLRIIVSWFKEWDRNVIYKLIAERVMNISAKAASGRELTLIMTEWW